MTHVLLRLKFFVTVVYVVLSFTTYVNVTVKQLELLKSVAVNSINQDSIKVSGKKLTFRYQKTINPTLNLSCLTVFFLLFLFLCKEDWSFDHLLFQYLLKFIIMKAIPTSVSTFFLPLK